MPAPRPLLTTIAALVVLLLAACGSRVPPQAAEQPLVLAAAEAMPAGADGVVDVGGRPVEVQVPPAYDPARPAPLLVVLHGFGSDAARVDATLGLREEAMARGALYALPEGTVGPDGRRFWNAGDACCGVDRAGVDDSAFLALVIRTLAATYAVDPDRVAVVGYSNGGFMAYRTACDHAALLSVAVSVAGATPADDGACRPSRPVTVVQAHGTDDPVIRADGGLRDGHAYPSAAESAAAWARLDGCATTPASTPGDHDRDLDTALPGAETDVTTWTRCKGGASVELWSIQGADHAPTLGAAFAAAVLDVVTGGR
ncbi:alpha/beta hydrolase family esterase [Krasilnikoviella flava]|uniref:Polyhydroxybutyrate depolymerase n=1 Tax=Krasilnikoviella flava TaxID=526729 RepID=A0A1T5LHL5_9MICO|nr:PHB depolymerase family esterase [Krasilnikoviella flava]SKC75517.1 polyhydroxybutyrate depolymerase [Krasilnikoviella flava]